MKKYQFLIAASSSIFLLIVFAAAFFFVNNNDQKTMTDTNRDTNEGSPVKIETGAGTGQTDGDANQSAQNSSEEGKYQEDRILDGIVVSVDQKGKSIVVRAGVEKFLPDSEIKEKNVTLVFRDAVKIVSYSKSAKSETGQINITELREGDSVTTELDSGESGLSIMKKDSFFVKSVYRLEN